MAEVAFARKIHFVNEVIVKDSTDTNEPLYVDTLTLKYPIDIRAGCIDTVSELCIRHTALVHFLADERTDVNVFQIWSGEHTDKDIRMRREFVLSSSNTRYRQTPC